MATGRPLLGVRVSAPLRVWVWNGEDPREEIERRLLAACLHYRISAEEIGGRLFIDSGREMPLVIAQKLSDGITVLAPVVEAITTEIRARSIDVIIIDPFVSCHGVPENDNGAIDRVAKTWAGIAEACNCSIELVHHVRKAGSGQTGYTIEDARGGSALIGAVRSARVLNVMTEDEAQRASVSPQDRRRFIKVDDGKANMAPPIDRVVWREIVSVGLGNGDADGPEDLVGVVTSWAMPGAFDGIEVADLIKVQAAIAAGTWGDNSQADDWAGFAVANALGINADSSDGKQRIKTLLRVWVDNGALKVDRQLNTKKGRPRPMIIVGERG